MEYLDLNTGTEQHLSDFFSAQVQQFPELWLTVPPALQQLAKQLYANTALSQRCAYDDVVTCHSIFKPEEVTINGKISDGNASIATARGTWTHVLMENQTGDVMSVSFSDQKSLTAEQYLEIIKKSKGYQLAHKNLGFIRLDTPRSAVLNGRSAETIGITEMDVLDHSKQGPWPISPFLLTKHSSNYYGDVSSPVIEHHDRLVWAGAASSQDGDMFGTSASFHKPQCDNNVRDMLNDGNEGPLSFSYYSPSKKTLHLTRFQTVLTAYGFPDTLVMTLVNEISHVRKNTMSQIGTDILSHRAALLQKTPVYPLELQKMNDEQVEIYSSALYPTPIRSFILAGASADCQRNRREFIHQIYQMMFGDSLEEQLKNANLFPKNMTETLKDLIGISSRSYAARDVIEAIDSGKPWLPSILARFELKGSYSKNEFKNSLRAYTEGQKQGTSITFSEALRLSKIPMEWVATADGKTLFTSPSAGVYNRSRMVFEDKPVNQDTLHLLIRTMKPFLAKAGAGIAAAQLSGDKALIKKTSKEWAWLAKANGDAFHSLLSLDKKMNIEASYKDLPRILNQFCEAVMFRAVKEFPGARNFDIIELHDSDLSMNIKELERCAESHFNDNQSDEEGEWDEDEERYVEYEPLSFSEQIGACTELDASEIWDFIKNGTSDFRLVLELNHDLHKVYNTLIQQMNEYSKHQIGWTPFLNTPERLTDDVVLISINDRLSLLTEGGVMGHCVFSYMGNCAAGRSVILGVRHKDDLEKRIATVELAEEDGVYVVKQCYGPHNHRVDAEIEDALHGWVLRLNNGDIPYQRIENSSAEYDDFYNDIARDPLNEGAKAHTIPYDTDAVYSAILAVERHIPQQNIEQLFQSVSGGLSYVFTHSDLYSRGYKPMKDLAIRFDISPDVLLRVKSALSVPWFDDRRLEQILPTIHQQLDRLSVAIESAVSAIAPPSGKQLSGEELQRAQQHYTEQLFAIKSEVLTQHLHLHGVQIDANDLMGMLRKTPAEQLFATYVTPALQSSSAMDRQRTSRTDMRMGA